MEKRIDEVKNEILEEVSEISPDLKVKIEEAMKTLENGDHLKDIKSSSKKEPEKQEKQSSNFWKYVALGALGVAATGAAIYLGSSRSSSKVSTDIDLSDMETLKALDGWTIE